MHGKALLGFFLTLGAAGCTAEMVIKKPPRQGPVPEVGLIETGHGEVKYATEGWPWIVSGRRRTAKRKARKLCKGMDYEVTDEFTREDVAVPYSQDELNDNLDKGLKHYNVDTFTHIIFKCVPKK